MPSSNLSLVWFRLDLRLDDNPALIAAARRGEVLPVFIWSPEEEAPWQPGGASRYWLHHALLLLQKKLEEQGLKLVIRRGASLRCLEELLEETGADAVFYNRRYEPAAAKRDRVVTETLRGRSIHVESFNGSLLYEPWEIKTRAGEPYRVFTPFWNRCREAGNPPGPQAAPSSLKGPARWPESLKPAGLELRPKIDWAKGIYGAWEPEEPAGKRLAWFLKNGMAAYETGHDLLGEDGTSRMSPYLYSGGISVRRLWHKVFDGSSGKGKKERSAAAAFLRQLAWRDFAYHLLHFFPDTPEEPLNKSFNRLEWRRDAARLKAWKKGMTGYPIVDAGMRQLWRTGWMHNRVRMIAGSFLVKDLLIPWQEGARWFWDTLVDADLANNTLNWQWVAGCGADAAPFFRVFNPVLQGEKFDRDGAYVRRWVPELARLPARWIHKPWEAPEEVLKEAGVRPGKDYPEPVVDHALARRRALQAYEAVKKGGKRG